MKSLLSSLLVLVTFSLSAQEKTFEREYTYKASEMDSKLSCRTIATNQIRAMLLNEIGVYVKSESMLKSSDVSGKFSQDFVENIATISAGITKLKVLDEKWDGETFWMKAAITIDRKELEESLKQLVKDQQRMKEMEELKSQLAAANKELDNLKGKLAAETKQGNEPGLSKRYNDEIETLNAADYFLEGNARSQRKDHLGALDEFSKAIEVDPKFLAAYNNRGIERTYLRDYEGAIADFTKAIEIDPNQARVYYNRGNAKRELKDDAGAIADFTTAISMHPNYTAAYNNRGNARSDLRDYEGAIADFTMAISLDPTHTNAYYNRGFAKAAQQNYEGAIPDFTSAIKVNARNSNAYTSRGMARAALHDLKGAINDFGKAIEIDPRDANAYYRRGLARIESGQKDSGCFDLHMASAMGLKDAQDAVKESCN